MWVCRKCEKIVTEAYEDSVQKRELFRCDGLNGACGCAVFIEQPDPPEPPKVKWHLSRNDKMMIRRHETKIRNAHDD